MKDGFQPSFGPFQIIFNLASNALVAFAFNPKIFQMSKSTFLHFKNVKCMSINLQSNTHL